MVNCSGLPCGLIDNAARCRADGAVEWTTCRQALQPKMASPWGMLTIIGSLGLGYDKTLAIGLSRGLLI